MLPFTQMLQQTIYSQKMSFYRSYMSLIYFKFHGAIKGLFSNDVHDHSRYLTNCMGSGLSTEQEQMGPRIIIVTQILVKKCFVMILVVTTVILVPHVCGSSKRNSTLRPNFKLWQYLIQCYLSTAHPYPQGLFERVKTSFNVSGFFFFFTYLNACEFYPKVIVHPIC